MTMLKLSIFIFSILFVFRFCHAWNLKWRYWAFNYIAFCQQQTKIVHDRQLNIGCMQLNLNIMLLKNGCTQLILSCIQLLISTPTKYATKISWSAKNLLRPFKDDFIDKTNFLQGAKNKDLFLTVKQTCSHRR